MLMFGLRLGDDPRAVVTTTPRPTKLIRALLADPKVVVTRGRTDRKPRQSGAGLSRRRSCGATRARGSAARNSTPRSSTTCRARCGAHAIIDGDAGERARRSWRGSSSRSIPAAGSSEDADETGIVVAGRDAAGHGYVLADRLGPLRADRMGARRRSPPTGAHDADRIVAEINNGGEMVEATLRMVDPNVPFTAVHAARGKVARAEPVAALYEQGRVHHLGALAAARRPDVRVHQRFRPRDGGLFARPGRCAGLGADRICCVDAGARVDAYFRGLIGGLAANGSQ